MEKDYARVVILAGQSNACGVARAPYLAGQIADERLANLQKGFARVPFLYWSHGVWNEDFEPVVLKTGYRSCDVANSFGPEIGFAEYMAEATDETVYLVKWAQGGSSLWEDWNPYVPDLPIFEAGKETKPGWCLGSCLSLLEKALPRIEEISGKTPRVEAFLWMQGESDADREEHVSAYVPSFLRLLERVKEKVNPYLAENFCVVDAGISTIWNYYAEINEAKRKNAAASERTAYLDTIGAGLTTDKEPIGAVDIYHYDSLPMLRLGRLFAEAYCAQREK